MCIICHAIVLHTNYTVYFKQCPLLIRQQTLKHFAGIFAHLIIEQVLTQNIILMDISFGPYSNTNPIQSCNANTLTHSLNPSLTRSLPFHSFTDYCCLPFCSFSHPSLLLLLLLIHLKYCCDSHKTVFMAIISEKSPKIHLILSTRTAVALDMARWNISIHILMRCSSGQRNRRIQRTKWKFYFFRIFFFRVRKESAEKWAVAAVLCKWRIHHQNRIQWLPWFDANDNGKYFSHQRAEKTLAKVTNIME